MSFARIDKSAETFVAICNAPECGWRNLYFSTTVAWLGIAKHVAVQHDDREHYRQAMKNAALTRWRYDAGFEVTASYGDSHGTDAEHSRRASASGASVRRASGTV